MINNIQSPVSQHGIVSQHTGPKNFSFDTSNAYNNKIEPKSASYSQPSSPMSHIIHIEPKKVTIPI